MHDGYVTSGAGWFTLALVNAGLAQGKHRSGWNWFVVSLLLGPFATLLIVMVEPLEPPLDSRYEAAGSDDWS
ncbi:MAG: antitermination protein NusB [Catenulispora sp.]